MFVAARVIGGFEGTFQMVAGQTIIADIFPPVDKRLWLSTSSILY